ncbi:hypothetical protein MELA_00592 [Candidatus Methylomirabilis lanthanidiphila]|uniref:Uncharacterized protein n=1 Tax=Candidatus Methylomirabilis lanthanidiphila TaxID=2211376 RepID=A0A564ZGH4_9BACT|nr:hypothetical protein [Candidatus Methylomirabilis lanthanidiphila]VUZ84226.1 hypothetical protein MELA_00592 [Candidatus Methylomirabilis lanthanidiphila]
MSREGGLTRFLQVVETVAKLATPAAVIVAAWVGARLANSFQERMSETTLNSQRQIAGTTLLSEREKAESELRASMFNSLINPFVGSQGGERISADREQLLVELLALNFHEHFELKPLFERVDKRLVREGMPDARNALRSIADRIIDRQTATLRKEGGSDPSNGEGARIDMLTITEPPLTSSQQAIFASLAANEQRPFQVVGTLKEPIEDLRSPDGAQKMTIVVDEADWINQKFKVQLLTVGTKSGSVNSNAAFTLSRFDFPLTDNTLFSDGNRIALAVSSIRIDGGLKSVALKLIWFPKNYFTPRERPLDHGEFLKLVGKKT